MFKSCSLTIVLLIISFGLSAQMRTQQDSVRQYYRHINISELAIVDTNYAAAQQHYLQAFDLKYPNGKDLYNAFAVSYYLKDTLWATKFYNWLAFHGMKQGYFSDSASDMLFYQTVTAAHDSAYQAGYAALDKGAVEFWDIVAEFTGKYRQFTPDYYMNKVEFEKQAREMDDLNRENILGYLESGGKYSFKDIGFWTSNSAPHSSNYPLRAHMEHTKSTEQNLTVWYKKKCLAGELDITSLIAFEIRSFKTTQFQKEYGFNLYSQDLDKVDVVAINKKREKLYLAPVADYYKRRIYDNWHKMSSGVWERNMFIFFEGMR